MILSWRVLPERSRTVLVLLTLLAIVAIQYVLGSQHIPKNPQNPRQKVKFSRDFRKVSDILGNRGYHYMKKLVSALDEQLKDCDDKGDASVRHWAIQGYKPDYFDQVTDSVTFKPSRFNLDSNCNVSHIEFLLPLVRSDTKDRVWTIRVNGQKHTRFGGTVGMERVAIFNLTGTRVPESHAQNFKISLTPSAFRGHHPMQSALFIYCNINATVLNKLQAHHQRQGRSRLPANLDQVKRNFEDLMENVKVTSGLQLTEDKFEAPCDEQTKSCPKTNLETSGSHEANFVTGGRNEISHPDNELRSLPDNKGDLPSSRQSAVAMAVEDINTLPSARQERAPLEDGLNISDDRARVLPRKRRSSRRKDVKDKACACRREELWVSLPNALKHMRIVGSWRTTDLGRCEGSCSHALTLDAINENITAHAVLLNSHKNPDVAGNVTCAAHKMESVPLLTSHAVNGVYRFLKMTILQNLRILSCRCV